MKIAYWGNLKILKEGFEKLGHEVILLTLAPNKTFMEQLESLGFQPDIVLLEFFSDRSIPHDISSCKFPLAAYFIDAPLNAFWQIPLSHLFDYVFVDQISSQREFEAHGVKAVWLPLCACESDFRESVEKKFFCSFVGAIDNNRIKRKNLLEYIKSHISVDIFSGISKEQMLDIFSQSEVTLNENLFNGLTLRIFQGLAAGCLVLTEKTSLGAECFFEEGKHIAYYESSTILDKLDDIKKSSEYWRSVALSGQKECRENHMSVHRAKAFLDHIKETTLDFPAKYLEEDILLYEAEAMYMFCLRFGGKYYHSIAKCFNLMQSENSFHRMKAKYLFAKDVASRTGDLQKAIDLLSQELVTQDVANQAFPQIFLLLSQIYLREEHYIKAFDIVDRGISLFTEKFFSLNLLRDEVRKIVKVTQNKDILSSSILLLLSHCYAKLDLIAQVGFISPVRNVFYENATSCAIEAWKKYPTSAILDALFFYAEKEIYSSGELLPYFMEGIERVLVSNIQIVKTAEIALSYYQRELSSLITANFKVYLQISK